jgi:mitogen-activated protein kinase kinase 1
VVPLDVRDAVRRRLIAELRCLHASMSCPAIVPLHGAFLCDGSVAIVLELMDRGSLADVLKAFPTGKNGVPEQPLRCIAARVLVGLSYLHDSCHIIHRDLKPSNLLLNSRGEVKISDFGVSGQLRPGQPQSSTWLGTTRYMAPERIAGQQYDTSSDVWALGITLLECATGAHPYQEEPVVLRRDEAPDGRHAPHCAGDTPPDFWALHERITQHPPPQLEPSTRFSAACAEFLDHCLQNEGACRWSAEQLRQHPWVCARAGDLDGHDPAGEAGERCVAAFVATVTGCVDSFSMPSDPSSWLGSLPTGVRLRASPSASTLHTVAE